MKNVAQIISHKMEEATDIELRKYFYQYLENTMEVIRNHPEYDINKNNYHLNSEDGKLAYIVFDYLTKLHDLISDLKRIEVFMRRFPCKKFYEENDIDQLSYIKYHYEVFIHKIHTILEIKKLAVNEFYKIGLKERDCTWRNLKNQNKIKNTSVSKIIEIYHKTFEHIIKHRHLNTHRAYFADTINDELRIDYSIYKNSKKFNYEVGEDFRRMMPLGFLNYKINEYKKERIDYIKNGTEIAEKYVEQFETILITEFFNIIISK